MAGSQDAVRAARGGKLFGNKPDTVVLTTTKGLIFSFASSWTQYSKGLKLIDAANAKSW